MYFFSYIWLFLILISGSAYSDEIEVTNTVEVANSTSITAGSQPKERVTNDVGYESRIIVETIDKLVQDGFLTEENAQYAKEQYVTGASETSESAGKGITWSGYFSLTGAVKFLAVAFLLFAFRGIISNLVDTFFRIIMLVPTVVYQGCASIFAGVLTFAPQWIWPSEAFYLALTGSLLQLLVIGWVFVIYEKFGDALIKLLSLGMKPHVMAGVYLAIYFSVLAIMYQSSTFGVFAVASFVFATGFVIYQLAYGVALGVDDESYLPIVIYSNFLVLLIYGLITVTGVTVPYIEHFAFGIEYVCSLALSVCLLISALPWSKEDKGFNAACFLMVLSFALALIGAKLFELTTISAFMNTCFTLWILSWVGYWGTKGGFIVFSLIASVSLYGLALLLENHANYFVLGLF
ncbi:hypothetical protein [Litoribacillus peritrichatus]|uniref:DUF2157 domain-containing protein n=1 Tax=Litoribacillus peritrichatus TaxID=718191 RepID=A0ABP7ME43_9GAMM